MAWPVTRPLTRPFTRPLAQRRSLDTRDVTKIVVFAALLAVLGVPGAISVAGGAVPITAQTLGVMLAGAVLGRWRGAGAVALFLALVLVGLPLLSGGRGGAGVFVGPSAGFLIGWIAGAFVVGAIAGFGSRAPTRWRTALACFVGGVLVVYAVGIPVQSLVTRLPIEKTALTSAAFLPGDLLKVGVATAIVSALYRAYPRAFSSAAATPPRARPQTETSAR